MSERPPQEVRVEISAALDRRELEALRLELEEVARRWGVSVTALRVEKLPEADS